MNITLIVDSCLWILGRMGEAIIDALPEHRVRLFPSWKLRSPDTFTRKCLAETDLFLFVCNFAYTEFREADWTKGKVVIAPLHHVDDQMDGYENELRHADAIMVTSDQWRKHLEGLGFTNKQFHQVGYGVDTELFAPRSAKPTELQKLGLPTDKPVIGFFAKKSLPYSRKGADIFLDTVQLLTQRGTDCSILIVGPGWNEEVSQLRTAGMPVAYKSYVYADEMPHYYNLLDLYVCASRIEGGPVPVLEALSCGVPVISTRVGMVEQLVKDGKTGYQVDFGASKEVADRIQQLVDDSDKRKAMGVAGRELIVSQHKWEHIREPILGLLELATGNAALPGPGPNSIRRSQPPSRKGGHGNGAECNSAPPAAFAQGYGAQGEATEWDKEELAGHYRRMWHLDTIRFAARLAKSRNIGGALRTFSRWFASGPGSFAERLFSVRAGISGVLFAKKWKPTKESNR